MIDEPEVLNCSDKLLKEQGKLLDVIADADKAQKEDDEEFARVRAMKPGDDGLPRNPEDNED